MIKLFICILLFNSLLLSNTCLSNENFSLFFVRHAEKSAEGNNPGLTRCGKQRAKQLATLLSSADIKSIYSTSYQRTMSTSSPLSQQISVPIKNYSPTHLRQLSLQLKQRAENSLIVGHSNTTTQLVSLMSNKSIAHLTEDNYKMLYQLTFIDNKVNLVTLTQPLTCD